MNITLKECCICLKTLPESDFSKNRYRTDGLNDACKPCAEAGKRAFEKTHYGRPSRIATKEVMERFHSVINRPYLVWDSYGDIPEICASLDSFAARERRAISLLELDGIDCKKYFPDISRRVDVEGNDGLCYPPTHEPTWSHEREGN